MTTAPALTEHAVDFDPYEFDKLIWKTIWKFHARKIKRSQDSAHLDLEDLHQTGMTALWEHRAEFDGVTDPYKRGSIAIKIAGRAIDHMLTREAFLKTMNDVELVPILEVSEVTGGGDGTTLDLFHSTEDHAPVSDWQAAFTQLKPRTQKALALRQLGRTWGEIAERFGLTDVSLRGDIDRDLNRHGLWEYIHEVMEVNAGTQRLLGLDLPVYMRGESHHPHQPPAWKVNPGRFDWSDTKNCLTCGDEFPRDRADSEKTASGKKFCSNHCSQQHKLLLKQSSANTKSQIDAG